MQGAFSLFPLFCLQVVITQDNIIESILKGHKKETTMKIHISPKMIALMVQNAKTSEEIQAVHDLVKESAHPYQLGWILEQKIKKIREEQQQQQQETKK
jgi:hypothetical protein